jgi:hypothetical protein
MKMKTNDNGTDRDMTDEEIAAYNKLEAEYVKRNNERIKAENDKAKDKQALLDRLGITADEATLLLG